MYRDYVDLSVAVATPKGLVTPVVRNAEGMNFLDIEKEIAGLGKKARDGKLSLEDMAGGSFTMFVSLCGMLWLSSSFLLALMEVSSARFTVHRSSTCRRPRCWVRCRSRSSLCVCHALIHAFAGMHAIKEKPVVVDGQIVIRPIMVVALTYDHRLLDGREAVTFLGMIFYTLRGTFLTSCSTVKVRDYIEDPAKMLLA